MDRKDSKELDNREGEGNDDGKDSIPETHDEVQRRIAGLSISQETHNADDSTPSGSDHSTKPQEDEFKQEQEQEQQRRQQARVDDELGDAEEQEESRNIEPDELKNILFSFETPREVDLRVKISGDLNVTILA